MGRIVLAKTRIETSDTTKAIARLVTMGLVAFDYMADDGMVYARIPDSGNWAHIDLPGRSWKDELEGETIKGRPCKFEISCDAENDIKKLSKDLRMDNEGQLINALTAIGAELAYYIDDDGHLILWDPDAFEPCGLSLLQRAAPSSSATFDI